MGKGWVDSKDRGRVCMIEAMKGLQGGRGYKVKGYGDVSWNGCGLWSGRVFKG